MQMLASNYLPHGYWFYVTGHVPAGKDPAAIDQKILEKYGIALSRQQRARRKQAGLANLHYVRFERFFVLVATHGRHAFFAAEAKSVKDIRKHPLHFAGYSLSVKRGGFLKRTPGEASASPDGRHRVRVMISKDRYREFLCHVLDAAPHRSPDKLSAVLWSVPFEPYAPIRKQLLQALRRANAKRAAMGYEQVSPDCLRYRRRIVKPFEAEGR